MSMMKQKWSISGLSVELGIDRRTLAKKLDTLEPVEVKGKSRLYYMADVVKRLRLFDNPEPSVCDSGGMSDQSLAKEIAWFFDAWAPKLRDYLLGKTGKSDLDTSEKILTMVQEIWAIQLDAFKGWLALGDSHVLVTPEIIETLEDPDQFTEAAEKLVEFGPSESENPDIDLEDLLSKVDWSKV